MGNVFDHCFGIVESKPLRIQGNARKYMPVYYELNEDELEPIADFQEVEKDYTSFRYLKEIIIKKFQKFPKIQEKVKKVPVSIMSWKEMKGRRGYYSKRKRKIFVNKDYEGKKASIGILLHEIVHALWNGTGNELEAEVFENHLCDETEGATEPTSNDFDKFFKNSTIRCNRIFVKEIREDFVKVVIIESEYVTSELVFQKD